MHSFVIYSLINSVGDDLLKYLNSAALMVGDGASTHNIDYITFFLEDYKSGRASKSHYWFQSYSDFAECMDFAYLWSFSGGGSVINGAYPV